MHPRDSHPRPDDRSTGRAAPPVPRNGAAHQATTSAGRPRVAALDVLRGFALCGILLANVRPIAHAGPAFVPLTVADAATAPGSEVSAGALPWLHLLVDQRFMPIFSVLFGIGFALLLRAAADRSARPRAVLVRRLLVLLGIGLIHLLLWPGEILTTYAVAGLVVLLPSTWLPRGAAAALAALLLVTSLVVGNGGNTVIPGLFLLGSALVRYGVVDRMERSARVPLALGLAFAAAALPALWWQAAGAGDDDIARATALAGLLLAGVYVCALLVALGTRLRPALQAVFAPLGRMALTNYLTATVLVLAAGRVTGDPPDLWSDTTVVRIAAAVLAAQWLWSALWLRGHRYGPLEWLWRWATWGHRPLLRHAAR